MMLAMSAEPAPECFRIIVGSRKVSLPALNHLPVLSKLQLEVTCRIWLSKADRERWLTSSKSSSAADLYWRYLLVNPTHSVVVNLPNLTGMKLQALLGLSFQGAKRLLFSQFPSVSNYLVIFQAPFHYLQVLAPQLLHVQ